MVKLALIGVGKWGTNILQTLERIRGCEVKYICAVDPAALRALPKKYTTIADYRQLAKQEDIDGVLIATPGSTHARIALPFIRKGIPTYIEKPMTTSIKDALKIQKAARLASRNPGGGLIFAGHIHLYNPAYRKARELAKKAGKIRLLYFEGTNNGPFRDDMSAMWDWAPHDVYLALDLLKTMPRSVQAWGIRTLRPRTRLHDFTTIRMVFPNGVEAVSVTSWLLPIKQKKATIVGAKSTIVFDEAQSRKVMLYKNMGPIVQGGKVTKRRPTISHPSYSNRAPLEVELRAFLRAIKTGNQPLTNIDHGVDVIRVLNAAERSIRLDGRPVRC